MNQASGPQYYSIVVFVRKLHVTHRQSCIIKTCVKYSGTFSIYILWTMAGPEKSRWISDSGFLHIHCLMNMVTECACACACMFVWCKHGCTLCGMPKSSLCLCLLSFYFTCERLDASICLSLQRPFCLPRVFSLLTRIQSLSIVLYLSPSHLFQHPIFHFL